MSKLEALTDSVIFTFVQTTRDGFFRGETEWGFKMASDDIDSQKPRWGKVEYVGPDVKHVAEGDYILIEPLKWTFSVEFESQKYWRTLEPHIMGTTDTEPTDLI